MWRTATWRMWANAHNTSSPFMKPSYGLGNCYMKTTKRGQRIAADILTEFMFTKTMGDVINVWNERLDL